MDTTDTDHTEPSAGQSQDDIEELSPDRSDEHAARWSFLLLTGPDLIRTGIALSTPAGTCLGEPKPQ
jgi:hypothetical protein